MEGPACDTLGGMSYFCRRGARGCPKLLQRGGVTHPRAPSSWVWGTRVQKLLPMLSRPSPTHGLANLQVWGLSLPGSHGTQGHTPTLEPECQHGCSCESPRDGIQDMAEVMRSQGYPSRPPILRAHRVGPLPARPLVRPNRYSRGPGVQHLVSPRPTSSHVDVPDPSMVASKEAGDKPCCPVARTAACTHVTLLPAGATTEDNLMRTLPPVAITARQPANTACPGSPPARESTVLGLPSRQTVTVPPHLLEGTTPLCPQPQVTLGKGGATEATLLEPTCCWPIPWAAPASPQGPLHLNTTAGPPPHPKTQDGHNGSWPLGMPRASIRLRKMAQPVQPLACLASSGVLSLPRDPGSPRFQGMCPLWPWHRTQLLTLSLAFHTGVWGS